MSPDLARCLVDVHVSALELLGVGKRVADGLPEWSRERDLLRSACVDAVILTRSVPRAEGWTEMEWLVARAGERLRFAEALLRELRASRRSSQPHVSAGIEVAERAAAAASASGRMLAARLSGR